MYAPKSIRIEFVNPNSAFLKNEKNSFSLSHHSLKSLSLTE